MIRLRAHLLRRLRQFFLDRGVLEVETPLLSSAANSDPHIESFASRYRGVGDLDNSHLYLHTSPEFAMKRLLAAGSGPIYQLCKTFRNGESGRLHNPEFTMLEWYRPGFDHHQLMDEVDALLRYLMDGQRDLATTRRTSYRELFQRELNIDPFNASEEVLELCAERNGIEIVAKQMGCDEWLDLLMSHLIEPRLGINGPDFIHDYPASQASLARVSGDPAVAERFELYLDGVELANGFHELTDAEEQRRRFSADLDARGKTGLEQAALDERLLAALSSGLPDSAGVALGFDRLIMAVTGVKTIDEVITFPIARA